MKKILANRNTYLPSGELVTIFGQNRRFISISWKLVSTYLLLIILTLLLINSFISESMRINYVTEKKMNLLAQGNIIADRIISPIREFNENDDYEPLVDLMKRFSKEIKSRVMLLNKEGIVISDSYDVLTGQKLDHLEVQEALQGKSNARLHNLKKYGRTIYVAVPVFLGREIQGVVLISSSVEEIHQNIARTMKRFALLSLLSIFITGLISFIFAKVISSPIEKLTDRINKMHQGNLEQKVEVTGNDELSNLGNAFNLMTTKLALVEQQRKDFVANVSHELKTPLSAIKILSESLLHQNQADVSIYREFLKDIDSEVDRLNRIIENLLRLVDLGKNSLELDYQVTYVNYLIENLIRNLKPLADKKNISITFTETEKIQIKLDQIKIQQALINIISNGIKYTPAGGKVDIFLYSEYEDVVIKIEDNGIGIPKESLPHIFERFYRVDKARARSTGGTGLGLSISQQIIGLHQGSISVDSELGKGTIFYIKLPKSIGMGN
ncbi:sensor histidine kinase [Geosporobacter ferrireducens]|nr:HAMP domain-containing sensor histidine kinase [Geosporobacter ferrireducens]